MNSDALCTRVKVSRAPLLAAREVVLANRFSEILARGEFAVTAELNPPKGAELAPLLARAKALGGSVDAFNLTDSAGANMSMSPIAAAHLMADAGLEPILQITGRDRNRIALQADLLAAAALGVRNVLCMSGDPPGRGDHPDAAGVFDLKAESLLSAVSSLNSGADMYGNPLRGEPPALFAGAVANPGADDLDRELRRMEEKARLGAAFFQTQAVYDSDALDRFMRSARDVGVPVLAGVIVLKSARMARFLDENLPGVSVPQSVIAEMESAGDKPAAGVRVAARTIREARDICGGAHIMAIGWESRIPDILAAAGLER